ncbi:hypothetical protein TNCV_425152 [Trichonephila clavipes]|nr:hypothetical protein TNCV_425152 [Trichonephila clavipes]
MVPEPQGKVEKAQENHERFSQPRCPPPLSLTTPFRIYGRQLLFLRARGRHAVVHVPDGITRTALGTFPIQAASTRTVPVTTQRSGGCSSHGRHESVYGCASVVSTGPHQLITLHHDERLLLHVPVAVRGPQLRSSGGTCARVGHSARRFFRVVIAAAAARLCRGSDRDERRLAGHQHRFPAAKGTRTHRVHVGLQVKKRGEEFFFNVKRGSHFRPLLPSLPPISPQKNFQTDFCSDFLHCKPFG